MALAAAVLVQGCNGENDRGQQRGVFLDSPVSGLKYRTPTLEGFTDDDGAFYYQSGESVEFSIGGLVFAPVQGAATITPLEIAQVDDVEDEKAVNLLRLLQTIDRDRDPDNGITIPESAHERVMPPQLAFDGGIDVDEYLEEIVDQIYEEDRTLVESEVAVAHFVDTLSRQAQGEALATREIPLTFLIESDNTDYSGEFLSVQNQQYALNLDGSWESGSAETQHNVLRLKSDAGVNRFVTTGTTNDQLFYCISMRPTAISECENDARLFAVFDNESSALAYGQTETDVATDNETDEPNIGAAEEDGETDSGTNDSDTDTDTDTDTGTDTDSDSQDTGNQTPATPTTDTDADQNNGDTDTTGGSDNTDAASAPLRVVQTTTSCPSSANAPAQFTVLADVPPGCSWAPFTQTPWTWTPSDSYNSSSNLVTATQAGNYQGEFEHRCTFSDSGEVVTVTASCTVNVTAEPTLADITDLFFITGQANASGIETTYDALLDTSDNRVFAYTENGWQVADLQQHWEAMLPGNQSLEDSSRQPYNHIGFQVTKALAEDADRVVGLVVLTAAGEGISHWDYNSEFFVEVRNKATAALNELPHKSEFDAMIWMQGETDWLYEGTADPGATGFADQNSEAFRNYYPTKLTQLISNLRSEFWFGFDGRFICTETKKAALNPHLLALNSDGDPNSGCARASDLPTRATDPFGNHFSADALRTIGSRIADIYLSMD